MHEQRVEHRSMKGVRGFALVALTALAVLAGSSFFAFLERYIGNAASLLFILYGCLIAWLLLDRFVLSFVYSCSNGCLRVRRAYGKRQRPMADVWLNGVQACGSLDDMRKRFPGAKVHRAVKQGCPIEPLAVAYNDAGKTAILLLQPDEPLRRMIVAAVRR